MGTMLFMELLMMAMMTLMAALTVMFNKRTMTIMAGFDVLPIVVRAGCINVLTALTTIGNTSNPAVIVIVL